MPEDNASASLQGYRIALTIAASDRFSPAGELIDLEAGLIYYPVVQTVAPDDFDALDGTLKRWQAGEIEWLLLPTPCAVEAVADRLAHLEISANDMSRAKIAIYGAMTRLVAVELLPSNVDPVANASTHAKLVESMQLASASSIAVPIAQRSRADWHRLLAATGATVFTPPAYHLKLGRGGDDLPGALWGGIVDAVIFLTENSVRHFASRLKADGGSLDMLKDVVVATLDPQTATAAHSFGLNPQVSPADQRLQSLAAELAQFFSSDSMRRR
jgi:uroporphyrinogen-III synthase